MGMSSYVMDSEEQFYEAAGNVKLECTSFQEFHNVMLSQWDLVKHLEQEEVLVVLDEIWRY